ARACAAFGASRAAKGITNSPPVVAQFEPFISAMSSNWATTGGEFVIPFAAREAPNAAHARATPARISRYVSPAVEVIALARDSAGAVEAGPSRGWQTARSACLLTAGAGVRRAGCARGIRAARAV